ncbi:MAG: hypothetical protein ABIP41_00190 [Croceibacterium sp.]
MHLPAALLFASDAVWAGLAGAVCLAIALVAGIADRRRYRRARIDAVGWMPWTTLSFLALFCGVVLVSVALKGLAGR